MIEDHPDLFNMVLTVVGAFLTASGAALTAFWKLAVRIGAWAQPQIEKLIKGHLELMDNMEQGAKSQTAILQQLAKTQENQTAVLQKLSDQHEIIIEYLENAKADNV